MKRSASTCRGRFRGMWNVECGMRIVLQQILQQILHMIVISFHIPHSTFHKTLHKTLHLPHSTFHKTLHIPHSTFHNTTPSTSPTTMPNWRTMPSGRLSSHVVRMRRCQRGWNLWNSFIALAHSIPDSLSHSWIHRRVDAGSRLHQRFSWKDRALTGERLPWLVQ